MVLASGSVVEGGFVIVGFGAFMFLFNAWVARTSSRVVWSNRRIARAERRHDPEAVDRWTSDKSSTARFGMWAGLFGVLCGTGVIIKGLVTGG